MSTIPPANTNLVSGVAQANVPGRQRVTEKNSEDRLQARQTQEQMSRSDEQKNQVEDTLHAEDTRVRKHDEEESHQQKKHQHRRLPEDPQDPTDPETTAEKPEHIDLQA